MDESKREVVQEVIPVENQRKCVQEDSARINAAKGCSNCQCKKQPQSDQPESQK